MNFGSFLVLCWLLIYEHRQGGNLWDNKEQKGFGKRANVRQHMTCIQVHTNQTVYIVYVLLSQ